MAHTYRAYTCCEEEAEMERCKIYTLSKEEVILDGKKYYANLPKSHSRVKGIVLQTFNANTWEEEWWRDITDYRTTCYVLWKGSKDWKKEYEGESKNFDIEGENLRERGCSGIYSILFELETDEVRNEFLRKQEVKELKKEIKEKSKRLEELAKA